jgi:hypothetical protein
MRRALPDSQPADDVAPPQHVVGRVEVEVTVRGRARLRSVDAERQRRASEPVELRGGAKLVSDDLHRSVPNERLSVE